MKELSLEQLELIAGASGNGTLYEITTWSGSGGGSSGGWSGSGGGSWSGAGSGSGTSSGSSSSSNDSSPDSSSDEGPDCITAQSPANRIDLSEIESHEGGMHTRGYSLPPAKFPNSGLTISYGVDLGSKTLANLTASGISSQAVQALQPFLGLKGNAVVSMESIRGDPVISSPDAEQLFAYTYNNIVSSTVAKYDATNTTGVEFYDLPASVQTTLIDTAYNIPNTDKWNGLWTDIATGNFVAAEYDLDFWKPGSPTSERHTDLANQLEHSIADGELPHHADSACK